MEPYAKDELEEALRAVNSLMGKCEKAQEKLKAGTSAHTLLINRIKALRIAASLISAKLEEKKQLALP